MFRKLAILLILASCSPVRGGHQKQGVVLGASQSSTVQAIKMTWGSLTAKLSGNPVFLLDGGAGSYPTDAILLGDGLSTADALFFCNVQDAGAAATEGSVTAQISNDGSLWASAANATALIDGGIGDGGVPGMIEIGPTAAPYARLLLTTLGAQTAAGIALPLACTVVATQVQ